MQVAVVKENIVSKSERFPFSSFPNGWFALAWSSELAPEGVKRVKAFGRELVLFRTKAGVATVLDAFCPHLGTHLGYGCVKDETIQCPFHAWRFDGSGACVEVPNAKKIPPRAQVKPWLVSEKNGVIFVHHDNEGKAPAYELPLAPELNGRGEGPGDWTKPVHYGWTIKTHVQEICENLADISHFGHLHGLSGAHELESEFTPSYFRMHLGADGTTVDMWLYGLSAELSRVVLFNEHFFAAKFMTPLDADHVELRIASSAKITGDVSEAEQRSNLFKDLTSQALLQDVPLWENKRYSETPLLSSVDGPIIPFRKWAKQFYPAEQNG